MKNGTLGFSTEMSSQSFLGQQIINEVMEYAKYTCSDEHVEQKSHPLVSTIYINLNDYGTNVNLNQSSLKCIHVNPMF